MKSNKEDVRFKKYLDGCQLDLYERYEKKVKYLELKIKEEEEYLKEDSSSDVAYFTRQRIEGYKRSISNHTTKMMNLRLIAEDRMRFNIKTPEEQAKEDEIERRAELKRKHAAGEKMISEYNSCKVTRTSSGLCFS